MSSSPASADIVVTDPDEPVLLWVERKVLLSSYMHMLLHALLLESSNAENIENECFYQKFINPDAEYWCDDPIIVLAFDKLLINLYNGKGKGTQFCYNPEVLVLVYGSEKIYDVFRSFCVYNTNHLTFQPSGFVVFPFSTTYESFINVHSDFMNYVNMDTLENESRKVKKLHTYFGYVVLCSDFFSSQEYSRSNNMPSDKEEGEETTTKRRQTASELGIKTTHYIEYLENIEEHLVFLKIFFSADYGHPTHKMSFSSRDITVQLQKKFDVENYNNFLNLYKDYVVEEERRRGGGGGNCNDDDGNGRSNRRNAAVSSIDDEYCRVLYEQKPQLVVPRTNLVWKKSYLYEGALVVINDNIPHRFGCIRPPNIYGQKINYAPLIMVELNIFPIAFFENDEDLGGNMISISNFTLSPNPYHNTNFTRKLSNRMENYVAQSIVSTENNKEAKYESPFVLNGKYLVSLPSPLYDAYRGFNSSLAPFTWEEYEKIKEKIKQ